MLQDILIFLHVLTYSQTLNDAHMSNLDKISQVNYSYMEQ